jgi:hypothetical protein
MSIEMNCFRVECLETLSTRYRLFSIVGIRHAGPEFYSNIQRIIKQLSYQMRAPITTHTVDGETFLLNPQGYGNPPDYITLVGAVATLKDTGKEIEIRFDANSTELDPVRLRFLQFAIQNPLWSNPRLWLPSAGDPYFSKTPSKQLGGLDLFDGFAIRAAPHPEGGFGVIVDLRRKLVARSSLGAQVTRDQVNKLKGRSCVYRMGHRWYEVSLSGLDDRKVGEPSIPYNGKPVSLLQYLHAESPKPVPPSLAHLRPDGAAILYRTNGPQQKAAPAELCYLVEDTHSAEGATYQRETVVEPHVRYPDILEIVRVLLGDIRIGNSRLSVSQQPGRVLTRSLEVPSLRFGNDAILRLDNYGSKEKAVSDYGRRRLSWLSAAESGFHVRSPFDRQYLVMPRSVANSTGEQFIADLKRHVETLYPDGGGYDIEVIEYDDLTGKRDFVTQSRAIKVAIQTANVKPGHALVMQHRYERRARSADQLSAWTVKELGRQFELTASVIHTDMVKKAYEARHKDGETRYVMRDSESSRYTGYLRNVAINKILLTNGKWPFVLDKQLHADVVIGIDVKHNTAAFALIADGGRIIRFQTSPSKQKEQLLRGQVAKYVVELIGKETAYLKTKPKSIVIHRDGRAWPSEIDGINDACAALAKDGVIDADWALTVVDIAKSSPAPLRLFNAGPPDSGRSAAIDNPFVGDWTKFSETEAYVCTTGRPFRIPGTANPLHIRRAYGSMPIAHCADDVFALSCLTWSRPEGAMRLPISIKLCDRTLFDEAAEYDEDAIEFEATAEGAP